MSKIEDGKVQVVCPHCGSLLKVDTQTGEILFSKKKEKKEFESFDAAFQVEQERQAKKDDLFSQAMDMEKKRKELLEKKFQEAQKETTDDGAPPLKPIDLD